jgi:fructoselysine-6-P-deglycase FrlB-like protein
MFSFVRDYLGAPAGVDVDELKAQNEALKKQLEAKDAEIAELQKQVCCALVLVGSGSPRVGLRILESLFVVYLF